MAPAPGLADASATCVPGVPGDAEFKKHPAWECNTKILVRSSTANDTVQTAITSAIGIWNVVYGHDGLPAFVSAATSAADTVNVTLVTGSGLWFCGTTNTSSRQITIERSSSSTNCGGSTSSNPVQVGALSKIIAHELAHSIGFPHLSENGSRPAADHCVAALPDAGGLNGALCQLEILHVKYYYGTYDDLVEPSTYIANGFEVDGPTAATPPDAVTLRAIPHWDGAPPTFVRYTWSSTAPSIAQVSSSTTATSTVTAVSPGSTTIRVRITGSGYLVLNPQSGDVPFTVIPPPPTGLNATSITHNSALIRWTNGAAAATTSLYYKRSTDVNWTNSVTGITAGTTSRQLTNLAAQTIYSVRAQHVQNGQSSVFTPIIQFTTLAAPPPPPPTITNFRVTGCTQQQAGGKTYNYFTMAWDATPDQTTGSYQIAMNTTNNVAAAAVILTVPATTETGVVGGYLSSPLLMSRWFWVRYTRTGATTSWVALTGNPLASNQCLQ